MYVLIFDAREDNVIMKWMLLDGCQWLSKTR